jgi:MFS family permease
MAIAAFHPQSTTQAATLSGSRSGLGVAFFISAGMLGFSMGPVYFSLLSEQVGFNWLPLGIIPGVLVCAFLFLKLPPPKVADDARTRGLDAGALRATWKPIALHYGLVVLRSVVHLGIGQFLTLYLYNVRGFTFAQASLALTLFFASAAGGTVMGGNLADRFGGKRVVLVSMIGSVPFLYLFLASSGWVSLVSLFTGGLIHRDIEIARFQSGKLGQIVGLHIFDVVAHRLQDTAHDLGGDQLAGPVVQRELDRVLGLRHLRTGVGGEAKPGQAHAGDHRDSADPAICMHGTPPSISFAVVPALFPARPGDSSPCPKRASAGADRGDRSGKFLARQQPLATLEAVDRIAPKILGRIVVHHL